MLNIVKGKQFNPVRMVIHGSEGVGKTSLAAQLPDVLFIDTEGSTARLNVARVECDSEAKVYAAIGDLTTEKHGFKTVAIDTGDQLERMIIAGVCAEHKKPSIESFGYGKGFTIVAEAVTKFLGKLDTFQVATGINIIIVCHSVMRKQELPDDQGAFDRWELRLSKHVSPLFKMWCDALLFLNYKSVMEETESGKMRVVSNRRMVYTTHSACWDAKNRFGLPDMFELDKPVDGTMSKAAQLLVATCFSTPEELARVAVERELEFIAACEANGVTAAEVEGYAAKVGKLVGEFKAWPLATQRHALANIKVVARAIKDEQSKQKGGAA